MDIQIRRLDYFVHFDERGGNRPRIQISAHIHDNTLNLLHSYIKARHWDGAMPVFCLKSREK